MTGNLRHWNRFADIDPKFTKPIAGKAYKGTSPNPQYVILCLTEMFGPVGEGFGWEVVREEFQPLGEEVLHWCRIQFWHGDRNNRFDSYGQTKALMKTKNGLLADEDAPKKSLTDAIIKAASHIGIAANIFLGRWDDQKYVAQVAREFDKPEAKPERDPEAISAGLIAAVRKRDDLFALQTLMGADKYKQPLGWLREHHPEKAAHVDTEAETRLQALQGEAA